MPPPIKLCVSNKSSWLVKIMVRFALAGFYPKPERICKTKKPTSPDSAIDNPQHHKSVTRKNVLNYSIGLGQQEGIMDTFGRFSNLIGALQPTPPTSDSREQRNPSAENGQGDSAETSFSTPPRASSPEQGVIPKSQTIRGRHADFYMPPAPQNSVSSSNGDNEPPTPQLPRSRSFQARSREQVAARPVLHRQLYNLTRIEQEIIYYHNAGAYHVPGRVHGIIEHRGYKFDLRSLEPEQRIHFMGYIWRREWEQEASMIPSTALARYGYPGFWPKRDIVEDNEWRYYDHEGNVRPEAFVAMAEETGEGPYTWKELEIWRIEELLMGKMWMSEKAWRTIHNWVMKLEDGYDEHKMMARKDSGMDP